MKRVYAAIATAVILVGLIPAAASADRVTKFTDHYVSGGCDAPFDGGFVSAFFEFGSAGYQFLGLSVWLDPDDPFESDATASGFSETLDVSDDGTTIDVHASFPMFDIDGNPEGDAEVTISVARTGDIRLIGPDTGKTNYNSKTSGMEEDIEGSGTVTWDGSEIALPECGGVVGDVNFFSTNPRGFVSANTGVQVDCFWETELEAAWLFALEDGFGAFVDAGLSTGDLQLFLLESSGSVDLEGMSLDIDFEDGSTGDPYSATASATFAPVGSPVTSTLVSQTSQTKVTEQRLEPSGILEFSSGDSFTIDAEHCDTRGFESHSTGSSAKGPMRAPLPTNDGPDDAIALHVGSRLNTSNVGASPEPEIQLIDCPEGFFDQFGNTLWYTIEGTGSPITIDTAGSNFDTLIAVYEPTDPGYEEIACVDDVESEPIGSTYQAAVTLDTEDGVTYYVQIGGYDFPFDEEVIGQKGRLRIVVR